MILNTSIFEILAPLRLIVPAAAVPKVTFKASAVPAPPSRVSATVKVVSASETAPLKLSLPAPPVKVFALVVRDQNHPKWRLR